LNSSSFHFSGNIHKSCTTFSQEYKLYTRKEHKETAFCLRESALSDRNTRCGSVHDALLCAGSQGKRKWKIKYRKPQQTQFWQTSDILEIKNELQLDKIFVLR
jgi:hypothetical protein